MKTFSLTLKNGMKVYVYSDPRFESVGVAVGVNYGSIDEGKKINGAAHYLEHMLFKGTEKRSVTDIKKEIRDIGAVWNAFTTFETTVYFLQGYASYFEEMVDLLSDMIKNSTLPEKEFELERGPVINENLIHQDNPRFFFSDNFGKVLYKKHPAQLSVGGSKSTIEGINRADLMKIYMENYSPKNMMLVIYGNVTAKKATDTAKKYFGGFNRKYTPIKRPIANEAQVKKEVVVRKENLKQSRIGIGFKCDPYRSSALKEFMALSVISRMLSYRLFDEVREKGGLSYDPSAGYYPYSTFGFIGAQAGTEPKKIAKAKAIILGELGKLERGEITKDEVERAKSGLSTQYKLMREHTLEMANAVASYTLLTKDYRFVEKLPERIDMVSLADVKKYCRKYINTGRYSLLILKPS